MRNKKSLSNKQDNINGTIIAASHRSYSGPLPSPDDFAAYGNTLPNAPERIIRMTEIQGEHRRNIENKVLKYAFIESMTGQIIGFILALVFLGAAIWLAIENHESLAVTIIIALSSVIAIFVIKKMPKKENEQRE